MVANKLFEANDKEVENMQKSPLKAMELPDDIIDEETQTPSSGSANIELRIEKSFMTLA